MWRGHGTNRHGGGGQWFLPSWLWGKPLCLLSFDSGRRKRLAEESNALPCGILLTSAHPTATSDIKRGGKSSCILSPQIHPLLLLCLLEMLFHSAGLFFSWHLQKLKLETLLPEPASLTFPYPKEAKLLAGAFDIRAHNSPGVC